MINKKIFFSVIMIFVAAVCFTACFSEGDKYYVSFFVDDELYAKKIIAEDGGFSLPDTPVKAGYEFSRWLTAYGTEISMIRGQDLSLYAEFSTVEYTIEYDYDGGNADNPTGYTVESKTIKLKNPTKDGYEFAGWTDGNGKKWGFTAVVMTGTTGNLRFTAHWVKESYKITIDYGGGSAVNPSKYTEESEEITLENPVRRGYDFAGWTDGGGNELGMTAVIASGTTGNLAFVAKWTPIVYTIEYDYDGGNAENPTTYTIETHSFTLARPTRSGFAFVGYTGTGLTMTTADVTIHSGTTGNLTFKAVWSKDMYSLNYAASEENIPLECNYEDGASIDAETEVTLRAPQYGGNYRFAYWLKNGEIACRVAEYSFAMPHGATEIQAVYRQANHVDYEKSEGGSLTLGMADGLTPTAVYGENVVTGADAVCENGSVTLSENYLISLPEGEYVYYVSALTDELTERGEYFYLRITESQAVPYNVSLIYDNVYFPAAVLSFGCDCGREHYYSLDDGEKIPVSGFAILENYDKSTDHTVKIFCGDEENCTEKVFYGYVESAGKYYEEYFEFNGCRYDYVAESQREFGIILEYLSLVEGVRYCTENDTTTSEDYYYWIGEDFAGCFGDGNPAQETYRETFTLFSTPMSLSYSMLSFDANDNVKGIRFNYDSGFNYERSAQNVNVISDSQDFFTDSPRGSDYDGFAIEKFENTQIIRNMYELEALDYGVKPVFTYTDNGNEYVYCEDALAVYEAAKEILRNIIDDGMDDYEKVTAIYYWLGLNVTYDTVAAASPDAGKYRCFTVYGAIMDRIAVCDGYASAFRLMCLIEGIECVECTGITDMSNPNTSGHAWNKYRIDGIWYGADSTWAGKSDYVTMRYLFMSEAELLATSHYENGKINGGFSEHCASSQFDFYEYYIIEDGTDLSVDSQEEITRILEYLRSSSAERIEVYCESSDFESWLGAAVNALRMGVSYSYIGNYYCLELK